jgi:hypothetical protein
MNLRELVENYREIAGGFGKPVPLEAFGLAPEEITRVFGAFDEDYHISRFLHFTLEPQAAKGPIGTFQVNGFAQSHVAIDREIETIL